MKEIENVSLWLGLSLISKIHEVLYQRNGKWPILFYWVSILEIDDFYRLVVEFGYG